jgi:hypothetical protein
MEGASADATGTEVLRGVDSQYVRRTHWNGSSGDGGGKGVPSAIGRGCSLKGMESKPVVRCAHCLRQVANLENERLKEGVDPQIAL